MTFTHLRPNLFMQGLLAFSSSIKSEARFYAPIGEARVSIAAAALTETAHERKTYDVTGPEALTHAEMASKFSEASGKQVNFVDIPESAMREALLGFGLSEWQAEGLIEDDAHYRRGEAANVSITVQEVTGHPARSFEGFARDYKEVLHD